MNGPVNDTITTASALADRIDKYLDNTPTYGLHSEAYELLVCSLSTLRALTNRATTMPSEEEIARAIFSVLSESGALEYELRDPVRECRPAARAVLALLKRDHISPENVSVWQPIETAPKDGTPILTFTPSRDPPRAIMFFAHPGTIKGKWVCEDGSWYVKGPTHWAALPDTSALTSGQDTHD